MEKQPDSLELNIQLKEDIATLEKMYANLVQEVYAIQATPELVHSMSKMIELMCTEQIKAQRGEPSSQMKIETVEQFAIHLNAIAQATNDYLEKKFHIRWDKK